MTDFASAVPQGTIGLDVSTAEAIAMRQKEAIKSSATQQLGRSQTTYQQETAPQLRSDLGVTGSIYGTSGAKAMDTAKRHYEDSQYGIISGAHRALDNVEMQRMYQQLGLIA